MDKDTPNQSLKSLPSIKCQRNIEHRILKSDKSKILIYSSAGSFLLQEEERATENPRKLLLMTLKEQQPLVSSSLPSLKVV